MEEELFEEIKQNYLKKEKEFCPLCEHKLQKRYEGMVCLNWKCPLHFKLEKGWVYLDGTKKNNMQFFKDKYDFDIERFENQKKWLILKSKVLSERGRKCEICGSEIEINVHHILSRTEYPNLTLDEENLIVLCGKCHRKIHEENKRTWRTN